MYPSLTSFNCCHSALALMLSVSILEYTGCVTCKCAFPQRRVWRYQRGNQNPYIEEEQTTQWPTGKVRKDKQRSTKHTYKTKDRVTRAPLKIRDKLRKGKGKYRLDINNANVLIVLQMFSCPFSEKILRIWGSSVDYSARKAPNCGHPLIHGRIQHDLCAGFQLICNLLIAPLRILMHKAAAIPPSFIRTILFRRESDFYIKKIV